MAPPLQYIDLGDVDAVMISDYDKGAINLELVDAIKYRYRLTPIFVDSKKLDLSLFKDCILKINSTEYARAKLPYSIPQYDEEYRPLIVTQGEMGAYSTITGKSYDAPDVDVFDVTGAGDVFFAAVVYYYLKDRIYDTAISKAVHLASRSVQHHGVYTITQEDIDYVESLELH